LKLRLGQTDLPDGQSDKILSTTSRKNIPIFRNSDLAYGLPVPHPHKGRLAIAADVARNVVDGSMP
jgi:hypothetical protein